MLKGVSEIGFDVCASLFDGHRTNMKLYRELGGGKKLNVSSENPHTGGPIFHCFDNTHLFKNFYTNFMNIKHFVSRISSF